MNELITFLLDWQSMKLYRLILLTGPLQTLYWLVSCYSSQWFARKLKIFNCGGLKNEKLHLSWRPVIWCSQLHWNVDHLHFTKKAVSLCFNFQIKHKVGIRVWIKLPIIDNFESLQYHLSVSVDGIWLIRFELQRSG